jgi:hypothetical protein
VEKFQCAAAERFNVGSPKKLFQNELGYLPCGSQATRDALSGSGRMRPGARSNLLISSAGMGGAK